LRQRDYKAERASTFAGEYPDIHYSLGTSKQPLADTNIRPQPPAVAVESSHQQDLESMATVGKQMRAARLAVVQSHAASR
jgi:hypothetical protein